MRRGVAGVFRLAREVKLVVFDCDGVLTDGRIAYQPDGSGWVSFHTRDGHGLRLLREAGIGMAWVSGNGHEVVRRRARALRLPESHLFLGTQKDNIDDAMAKGRLRLDGLMYYRGPLP